MWKRLWKDLRDFKTAIFALVLYNVLARSLFHAFCPQLILTGFPCAGCGMTRAVFLYSDRAIFQRNESQPRGAAVDFVSVLVLFQPLCKGRVFQKAHPSGWEWSVWLRLRCMATVCFTVFRESRRWYIIEII